MSKLSIIIASKKGWVGLNFLTTVQEDVNTFFAEGTKKKVIDDKQIIITWYDDAPVSDGVALTATFQNLDGFDYLAELQTYLRKNGYNISVTLGY
jgi:hypothetical protein